jgi:hypothetical protein
MKQAVHLYGITFRPRQKQRLPLGKGVGDPPAAVRVVSHRDLAAVLSDSPYTTDAEGSATRERVRSMRRDMLAHSEVLNRLLARAAVLPVRFGVTLPDEASVVQDILEPQHDLLVAQLERVEGAVEVSLKVSYEEEEVLRTVVREHPHLAAGTGGPGGRVAGSALAERIELGRDIAAAIQAKADQDRVRLLERLGPLAVSFVEVSRGSELMVLDAAFLVKEDRLDRFDQALDSMAADAGREMRFNCVGPLPPYSFVNLRLGPPADDSS